MLQRIAGPSSGRQYRCFNKTADGLATIGVTAAVAQRAMRHDEPGLWLWADPALTTSVNLPWFRGGVCAWKPQLSCRSLIDYILPISAYG